MLWAASLFRFISDEKDIFGHPKQEWIHSGILDCHAFSPADGKYRIAWLVVQSTRLPCFRSERLWEAGPKDGISISIAHLWNRDILNDSINIPAAWPIYSDVYNIVDNIAVFLVCRCGNVWIQQIHPPQAMATAVVSTSPLHHVRLNVSSTEDWH